MWQADPPPPRAVVFDWDNTLVDTWGILHRALNATLVEMGHAPWSLAETRARLRHSVRDGFPRLFGERAGEAERVFYAAFEAESRAGLTALPGAAALLDTLWARGVPMGVLSNKRGEHLRREIGWLGWDAFFVRAVGAGDASGDKPAPAALAAALPAAGPADTRVWLAGDTDIDLEAAHAAGCLPVLLRAHPPEGDEFANAPPALHFAGCDALGAWVLANIHARQRP